LGVLAVFALRGAETARTPYLGVTIFEREAARIVKIDLRTPGLRFALTPPSGSREAVRETTLAFLEKTGAQIALNAHFFEPFPSQDTECNLIGLAVADGIKYSDFEKPRQSYALVPNAPALVIGKENQASIVQAGFDGTARVAVAGSAQVISGGRVTIPVYGVDLEPGGPAGYGPEKSWYDVRTSRTLIGLSEDRSSLFLMTAEKMPVREAAAMLAEYFGVFDALNLDGGGSTTLAMRNPETGAAETLFGTGRAVCSSLAVFAPAR